MQKYRWTILLAVVLGLAGCGEFIPTPGSEDNEPKRLAPGYTPCGDAPDQSYGVICHPNQYCSSQHFATCSTGCLSNDNCTDQQRCFKEYNEDIGTCVQLVDGDGETTDDNGESESEQGYTTCGDGLICHPNQYCADDYWGDCELGCLSNDNCTDQQRCDKESGENIGICVDNEL